jgi:hypothetical protein
MLYVAETRSSRFDWATEMAIAPHRAGYRRCLSEGGTGIGVRFARVRGNGANQRPGRNHGERSAKSGPMDGNRLSDHDLCRMGSESRSKLLAPWRCPGARALARACNYRVMLGLELSRFWEHPELELSITWQKDSIHSGVARAGPKIAPILINRREVDGDSNFRCARLS